ncbi:MAG: 50S ribosomal protein L39e [archaeon]
MSSIKHISTKTRLAKKGRQNRIVPLWVIMKTNRKVRTHPQRRYWRASDIGE